MFKWFKRKKTNILKNIDPDKGLREHVPYTLNGKPITITKAPLKYPRFVCRGDTLHLKVEDPDTERVASRSFVIDEYMTVDEVFTFKVNNEFGYEKAIIGGFGQRKKQGE